MLEMSRPRRRRRKSARVYVLHGERRDLHPSKAPAERVLKMAIENGLADVILVGTDRMGELYVAGSYEDCDKAVGVLMRGVSFISGGRCGMVSGDVRDTDEQ